MKKISPKLSSIKEVMLQESWFYLRKNTLFVMSAKWPNLLRVIQKIDFSIGRNSEKLIEIWSEK